MLGLLTLPIQLLRIAFYALQGLVDVLRSRNRLRAEFTILVNASREAVWRLSTADHLVLDGPPSMEISPAQRSWHTRFRYPPRTAVTSNRD
jgi:hypothetical protein